MHRTDFQYDLPEELIAQYPPAIRGDSRLLVLDRESGQCSDHGFQEIIDYLQPGDLLVLNDTRVMPARMFGHKQTGGKVEILIERLIDSHIVLAHVKASKSPKPGSKLMVAEHQIEVLKRADDLFVLQSSGDDFHSLMTSQGHMPLPGYIHREDEDFDSERYQTVYANELGAVAAPTAGLHFDQAMLARIADKGINTGFVTLHVGAGTFQPVRVDDIDNHVMHSEWVEVDEGLCRQVAETKKAGGRVIAVGTTAVRSLESAAAGGDLKPFKGDTRLFITPGFKFQVVDVLLTNFHLPESTLLMLTSAFGGYEAVMAAYRHAVAEKYRFFSYGDAMLIR